MQGVRWLVYGNFWIALGAALVFAAGGWLQGLTVPTDRIYFVGLSAFVTYNLHWLLAGREFQEQMPSEKSAWYVRHYAPGVALWLAAVLALFSWLPSLSEREWWFFGHLALISVWYNLPTHRFPWVQSIRRIPYLKIFLIAYVWACLGATYPALLLGQPWITGAYASLWGAMFLFIVAITLPFDVRDLHDDEAAGLNTLPRLLGLRATRGLALGLLLSAAVLWALVLDEPWLAVAVVGVSAPLILRTHPQRHELYFTGLIDGTLVVYGLVSWLTTL